MATLIDFRDVLATIPVNFGLGYEVLGLEYKVLGLGFEVLALLTAKHIKTRGKSSNDTQMGLRRL